MNKQDIERALLRASEQLPPVNYEQAARAPVQRMEVHDYITRQPPAVRRPRRWVPLAAAACLVLLLGGGGWYYWAFRMVYSTLYLSVNPAFAITLNREDKVLGVEGRNGDAEELLVGRSYRDWTLDALLGTLADDMAAGGYLTSAEDQVTVRVESRSGDRAKVLTMETEAFFAQRFAAGDSPEEDVRAPGDTPAPTPAPTPTSAPTPTPAPTPMQEHHGGEKPSGRERITPKEARDVVLAQEPNATIHDTKLDENDGVWVYEMECYVGDVKYDAEVDAITGELLKWETDD